MKSNCKKQKYQNLLNIVIPNSPELIFWTIFALFGGVAAGWLFVGIGFFLVMLLPSAYFMYIFFKNRKKHINRSEK
jgi:uncharacterized membrane protein YukC